MGSEKVDYFSLASELLPAHLRTELHKIKERVPEEIRLRCGRALTVSYNGREYPLSGEVVSTEDILLVLEKATGASMHSALSTMKCGFLPYKGLRIGVCGRTAVKDGDLVGFSNYRSIVIRIPLPFSGDLLKIAEKLCGSKFINTLIVSPPGIGKTTALRELVRLVSNRGYTVSVVDERDEIFPDGGYDIGAHTDVLTGTNKANGTMMLLRSMGPRIIALDEISRREDIQALEEIYGCGVGILATAHGSDLEDMKKRKEYRTLFDSGVFRYILKISADGTGRHYELTEIPL